MTRKRIIMSHETETITLQRPTHGTAECASNKSLHGLFDTELLPTKWMSHGNCADAHPSVFFPRDGLGVIAAQQICKGCPVVDECLEYALSNHISHGVWGGASERQRRRILSEKRRSRLALAKAQTAA